MKFGCVMNELNESISFQFECILEKLFRILDDARSRATHQIGSIAKLDKGGAQKEILLERFQHSIGRCLHLLIRMTDVGVQGDGPPVAGTRITWWCDGLEGKEMEMLEGKL